MRWVFIRPCNHSPYYDPEIQEPLGAEYLSASRRAAGDQVLLLDSALDSLTDVRLARRAAAFRPDFIGFSLTTAQEVESVTAIYDECVKALAGRSVFWLAGGNFVSTEPETALSVLPADFLMVPHEGELTVARLSDSRGDFPKMSAAADAPNSADRVIPGEPVDDLDSLAFPDRPFAKQILGSGWAFNLQGSRGCCGSCLYCASPGMGTGTVNRWRGRSMDHIVEEIAWLGRQYGARAFNFVDEDFLGPDRLARRRAVQFVEGLARRDLNVSFGIQVRPTTLDEEIVDLLTEAGLIFVFMGIESDSREDLKRWSRPWAPDPWRLVRRLRERGAEVNAGVLLFHSHSTLPGIRRFATKLHQYGLLNYRSAVNRLDAMPGSVFHARAIRAGQIDPDSTGPQPLPFVHPGVEPCYHDLLAALAPLGPPSMQAICSLPPLISQRRLDERVEPRYRQLMRIITYFDDACAETLFSILDSHEKGTKAETVSSLQRKNLEVALKGTGELVKHGFASSVEEIREAIRTDAGL